MILNDNPSASKLLKNDSITVVVRKESSGTTGAFQSALRAFEPNYPSTADTWPISLYFSRLIRQDGNAGVSRYVYVIPNSIGYITWGQAVADGTTYGKMYNKAGTLVSVSDASVKSAMRDYKDTFFSSNHLTTSLVDAPGVQSVF